ncbi:YfbR-like 5'-deoxynucleotidase [Thiomonas bhubaneswarensis]|uniref:5'-deoxynucleotidase YfbR and related HD superfamily hydrolases n=1 Tax=Thiomonas bhubaneswarensis TaxID=339866 RepID=A0A0K6I1F6_9BURK|nr:YfbR-like 5'-deoxynucleotidase [Thiomonas bhubaneswarensis]CUA96994.1 hypothetical protein Ga0061069_10552 [Thiomonas bhubaneswarensis]
MDYGYRIEPRSDELGGGWRLRLLENGEEIGGGIFPAGESDLEAYDDAQAEASAWLGSRPQTSLPMHMMSHSGIDYLPGRLRVRDVQIADIAHALSLICRFGGHCTEHYSVAQHSLLVVRILESMDAPAEAMLCGLMHDAHEAYVGDVPTPIKAALGATWADLEHQAEDSVLDAFGLRDAMNDWRDIVKHADRVALATERRDVLRFDMNVNQPWAILEGVAPHDGHAALVGATPQRWAALFLEQFFMLREACGARSSIFTT